MIRMFAAIFPPFTLLAPLALMASLPLTTAAAVAQTAAGGQTGGAVQHSAGPEVRKLLLLMDKDQNGKVSRTEFMAFMAKEFDRLDVNKDGELDVNELTALRVSSKHPGGAGSK